jgi:membrane-associated phospholipid phosphatase
LLKGLRWFLLAFFLLSAPSFAQNLSSDDDVSLGHLPDKILTDLPHLFMGSNAAVLAVGTGATAFTWAGIDSQNGLAGQLQGWNTPSLWNFGNFYGEGWVEGFGAVGSWSFGALVKDKRLQLFGRDASESLLISTVLVTGLKNVVHRERPDGSNDQSFPSGHTIIAFCIGPVVEKYWGLEAGIAAYGLGTLTALARVEGEHHYLSDTFAAAALGIVVGNAVIYTPKDVSVGLGPQGQAELTLAFN